MKNKIAVGCGTRFYGEDWYHLDITSHPNVDLIGYAHNIPLPDESVDLVYASHVLEYYDWDEAENIVLPEWKRILKPGGKLRIAVPDFEELLTWYWRKGTPSRLSDIIGPLFGKIKNKDGDNIYHKSTYDYEVLCKILDSCGFKNISFWNWWEVEHSHIDDHSQAYLPKISLDDPDKKKKDLENGVLISLNVECIK